MFTVRERIEMKLTTVLLRGGIFIFEIFRHNFSYLRIFCPFFFFFSLCLRRISINTIKDIKFKWRFDSLVIFLIFIFYFIICYIFNIYILFYNILYF